MSSELIKHTTDASFDSDVLQAGQPVLVDYWAEWCGPCKMIAPILDEVSKDYDGRLKNKRRSGSAPLPSFFVCPGFAWSGFFRDLPRGPPRARPSA